MTSARINRHTKWHLIPPAILPRLRPTVLTNQPTNGPRPTIHTVTVVREYVVMDDIASQLGSFALVKFDPSPFIDPPSVRTICRRDYIAVRPSTVQSTVPTVYPYSQLRATRVNNVEL